MRAEEGDVEIEGEAPGSADVSFDVGNDWKEAMEGRVKLFVVCGVVVALCEVEDEEGSEDEGVGMFDVVEESLLLDGEDDVAVPSEAESFVADGPSALPIPPTEEALLRKILPREDAVDVDRGLVVEPLVVDESADPSLVSSCRERLFCGEDSPCCVGPSIVVYPFEACFLPPKLRSFKFSRVDLRAIGTAGLRGEDEDEARFASSS